MLPESIVLPESYLAVYNNTIILNLSPSIVSTKAIHCQSSRFSLVHSRLHFTRLQVFVPDISLYYCYIC